MAKFILGTKEKMLQIFDEKGNSIPATLVNAGPIIAIQVKNKEKDGYEAVKFGFGVRKSKNKKIKAYKHIKELRISDSGISAGDNADVSVFEEGDKVSVSGISKGKGFQGVVKRHGFHGGPRTHGQKHSEREPGSIGIGGIQRVLKGTRMAGRMGSDRTTVKNLKIVKINKAENQLLISGALPGRKGTLLEIKGI
ncbi:50S ribosomal protein L3 [Patescibacteria group bacterium]|nr:50S ribosomal protein L3 [Patescibacteria group bacterium]MBU4353457.1 50S ribosomal protein L3 [Patescibacteria group bacterium]MBU4476976.1 50S ribosomal protein L3 [Patescibacteria group bacterium]MCG2699005.1 50S ribosomal protein L3 [Candidatus Parcubacteria bacterium]